MLTLAILQHASCRAMVATAGFRSDDWEDLRQDLALDCLRRSPTGVMRSSRKWGAR
jgi:hypothetical protein